MRLPHLMHTDAACLARLLNSVPERERDSVASVVIQNAAIADRYRRENGRMHPRHGDGSLMAATLAYAAHEDVGVLSEPGLNDPEWARLVAQAYTFIAEWLEFDVTAEAA